MMIHIWMHWFWITSVLRNGLVILLVSHVLTSSLSPCQALEAGLQRPVGFEAASQYSPWHPDSTGSRLPRDVQLQDEVDQEEEEALPTISSPSSSPSSTTDIPSSTPVLSSQSSSDFSSSDFEDTFNGENTDLFLPYPQKKYHSKYTDNSPSKYYEKFKLKPKNEGEIRVFEGRVDIHVKRLHQVPVPSPAADNDTTTEVGNTTKQEESGTEVLNDEPEAFTVVSTSTSTDSDVGEVSSTEEEEEEEVEEVEETALHTTLEPLIFSNKMAAAATSAENRERLHTSGMDAGSITGITLGLVVVSGLFGAISFVLYRRRYLNKPQVLNDKSSNLDSSGYIDDTSLRVRTLESCMRYKENSEEMYSLDNDSFLNSLEAMTIQNYWTENVKHTKL